MLGDSIAAGSARSVPRMFWVPASRRASVGRSAVRTPAHRRGRRRIRVVRARRADLRALRGVPSGRRDHRRGRQRRHPSGAASLSAVAAPRAGDRPIARTGDVVVVGTCPDLGALRAVPQPLRSVASALVETARVGPGGGRRVNAVRRWSLSVARSARCSWRSRTRCSASIGSTRARSATGVRGGAPARGPDGARRGETATPSPVAPAP